MKSFGRGLFDSVFACPDMKKLIGLSFSHFKEIKKFPQNRHANVAASFIKLVDESMSAWSPQTSKTGGLPHISFISRKPEPLGTEFKTGACSKVKIGLVLEIQENAAAMSQKEPNNLIPTAACAYRLAKTMENCGQLEELPELELGDAWFGNVKSAVALKWAGKECILGIKLGFGGTPKKEFDKIVKKYPAGAYLVCETTVPSEDGEDDVKLVFISYKYCFKKAIHFLMTKDADTTRTDPNQPYHAHFLDSKGNLMRRDVSRCAFLSFFRYASGIDSLNQMRQHELAL